MSSAPGCVGRALVPQVRAWAAEYGKLADHAWYHSGQYEWAQRKGDPLWDSDAFRHAGGG